MENNETPQNTGQSPQPNQDGVMDVQPPNQQINPAPVSTELVPDSTSVSVQPSPSTEPALAPVESAQPNAATTQGLSPELLAQAQKETAKPDTAKNDSMLLAAKRKQKNKSRTIVAVAVLVFLALAGGAVYAYMSSKDTTGETQKSNSTQEQEAQQQEVPVEQKAQPATTEDIDSVTKDLDEAINATDEEQEIPDGGLSEGSLGL